MATPWQSYLRASSYKGVAFEFISVEDSGSHELDRQRLVGVDGASIEQRAENELELHVRAVILDEDYPDLMDALVAKLREGGPGELVHPVHGTLQAAVERWALVHDAADAIDCAMVDITFVEHTPSVIGPFASTGTAGRANAVRSSADSVAASGAIYQGYLDDLAAAGTPATIAQLDVLAQLQAAVTAAVQLANDLENVGDSMSIVAITGAVNQVIGMANQVEATVENFTSPASYGVGSSLVDLASKLEDLASSIIDSKPPLVESVVVADMPLLLWAHQLYGDSGRVDELLLLNAIADPMLVRAGTKLVHYAV